jgi:hypothetical protein
MADRYGERLIWAALLRRWCWSAILLVCIGCHRPPADAPFHRFVEDVVPGQKWHEVKVRIGHETRNVLSAPYRSRLKGIELAQDGTITLGEVAEIEKVRWNTAGIRIQVQRWPAASGEEAGDDTATRVYVPLPAERDVVDLAGTEVQLLAAGEERRNMLVSAREAVALPQEHVTRPVRIPHSARLDFGIGLEGEENDVLLSGARFTLEVERGQERKTVFSQTLERGSEGDVHGWVDATVDLSDLAGSTVRFVFRTESVSGEDEKANGSVVPLFDWSPVWSSPILYSTEARRIDGTPNIILISLDTLRADHLGCYGYHRDTSPNIDKFAEGAFLFENCIAPASWTLPSHASVFTGLHPSVHGAETEPLCPPFAETEKTLTELARERGYLTAAYTEGGWVRGSQGFAQGFELYSDGVLSLVRRGCVEETFTSALQCSENYRNLPFFLFVHTYQVHRPYRPPRRFAEKFDKDYTKTGEARPRYARSKEDRIRCEARYDGEIAYTDEVVGKFLDRLREMDLLDRTAVVITVRSSGNTVALSTA